MALAQCFCFSIIRATAMAVATTGEEIQVQILLGAFKYFGRQYRQLNQKIIISFSQGM